MSSTEQTAEYFKDKSEEEIINWMTRNLTTDQIKSCLDGESTGKIEEVKPGKLTGNDLRKFCAGKRYVIHKIEGDNVLFWYYLSKSNKWNYSKESLSSFPQTIDQLDADECGQDTIIDSEDVKEAYNNNELTGENLFVQNNEDLDMNKTFNDVKNEYLKENINYSWMDTLILAINIQKNIYVPKEYNKLFKFCPILIESVNKESVNYYYLQKDDSEFKFVEANLPISKLRADFNEIVEDLNLKIIKSGEPGSSNSNTEEGFKLLIKKAANEIDSRDLSRIKNIYSRFPLSEDSSFFMDGLFDENSFGKLSELKYSEIERLIKKRFPDSFLKKYRPKKITNKNGTKTLVYVAR